MNMPASLIQQVDEYAKRMNLNRTSAMIFLVSTALEQKNAMSKMDELLNKLSELGQNKRLKVEGGKGLCRVFPCLGNLRSLCLLFNSPRLSNRGRVSAYKHKRSIFYT